MITFSPLFVLVPFAAYLFIHAIFALVNIGHLFKTGMTTFTSFVFTFIFIFYTIMVIGITLQVAGPIDLGTPLTINLSAFSPANPF